MANHRMHSMTKNLVKAIGSGVLALGLVVLATFEPVRGEEPKAASQDASTARSAAPLRQGPRRVTPGEHGVGRYVADVKFTDIDGRAQRLKDLADGKALVVAMTSTSCPISKKYLPTLAEIARQRGPAGVKFLLVNPVSSDRLEDMRDARKACGVDVIYAFDPDNVLARAIGAASTADVVVLDPSRTIVYHGAVDDQYGFGYSIDAPRQRYLHDALDAILADKAPAVAATEAPGCVLDFDPAALSPTAPTYHARVSRIVQQKCVECHREGGVAPFRLDRYEDVVAHAAMIKQVVERGAMPPWFAASPGKEVASPWSNDRSLSAGEKKDLLAWLQGGRPAGDPADAPRPREYADGWLIGKPDAIFQFAQPVQVKATGTMPYQNVTVETKLEQDQWVQAIEVRPGDPSVVHHVLVFVSVAGEAEGGRRDDAADERSGYWGIYVPGNSTLVYPEGMAKRIPKGARLRFQMHYTPNGKATEDATRIGLVYAKTPPKHEVKVAGIVNLRLNIPAGADNHEEVASLRVPTDVQILAFLPHMHLRGKAAKYDLVSADGAKTTTLLDVPRYDFNWQLLYRFAEPLPVSRGETLRFTAWYDNSTNNPANPDATKTVRWGPQTYDEMHLGYVEYILPGVSASESAGMRAIAPALRAEIANNAGNLFTIIDRDRDGSLTWAEVKQAGENAPRWKDRMDRLRDVFKLLDANGDEKLDKEEFQKIRELAGS